VLERLDTTGDLVDGAAVRHLALAVAELATVVLHGAEGAAGQSWFRASDGRGGSDADANMNASPQ
jgi:hypothetical protein